MIPATEQDVPELVQLVNSAYRGESSKKGWTTEADLLDGIRTDEASLAALIREPHSVIMKCLRENQLVGCVYLQKQGGALYLGMLTVDPGLQAAGIGKKMLQASEDWALQQHCTSVVMTVITDRKELLDWYGRRGYQSTGETKPFPNDPKFGIPKKPLEFVVLKKELVSP